MTDFELEHLKNLPIEQQIAERMMREKKILLVDTYHSTTQIFVFDGKRFIRDEKYRELRVVYREIVNQIFSPEVIHLFEENDDINSVDRSGIRISRSVFDKYVGSLGFLDRLFACAMNEIQSKPELVVSESVFDADPYLVNTPNGVLDLRTGNVVAHSPDFKMRCITKGNYVKGIGAPIYYNKIVREAIYDSNRSIEENDQIFESFLSLDGYSIIGGNAEKILPIVIGPTNTGKSTILKAKMAVLGDYADSISVKSLMRTQRSKSDIRPDLLKVRHARYIAAVESERLDTFDTPLLKSLSGNDEQSFRSPHGKTISFRMAGKIYLYTNEMPRFSNIEDKAFIKRLVSVAFRNSVPDSLMDKSFETRMSLQDEIDKIFTQLAESALKYTMEQRLFVTSDFACTKDRLVLEQSDITQLFWDECVTLCPENEWTMFQSHYPVSLIYSIAFVPFCREIGVAVPNLMKFGTRFREIADCHPGVQRHNGHANNYYTGIQIANTSSDAFRRYNIERFFGCPS